MADEVATGTTTTTPSAPSSTPSTSTSAPTPTTTAETTSTQTTSTTDRPSFRDALDVFNEQARQQGKRPRGQSTLVPPEGAATTQPGTPSNGQPPTVTKGPIPFDVHETALKNARTKERQAAEFEYGQRLQRAQQAQQWFEHAQRDPAAFVERNFYDGLQDPWMRQRLLSAAARALQAYRHGTTPQPGHAARVDEQPPAPDFQDGQGNQFYSAKALQARDQWLMNRMKADVLGQVQPALDQVEQMQVTQQAERQAAVVQQTMTAHLTEARNSWPYFKEHEPEIRAVLEKMPLTNGHPAEEALLLQRIYQRIVGPKLAQLYQGQYANELRSRANASTLSPSQSAAPSGVPANVRAKDGGSMLAALKWAAAQQTGRG